LGVMI